MRDNNPNTEHACVLPCVPIHRAVCVVHEKPSQYLSERERKREKARESSANRYLMCGKEKEKEKEKRIELSTHQYVAKRCVRKQ